MFAPKPELAGVGELEERLGGQIPGRARGGPSVVGFRQPQFFPERRQFTVQDQENIPPELKRLAALGFGEQAMGIQQAAEAGAAEGAKKGELEAHRAALIERQEQERAQLADRRQKALQFEVDRLQGMVADVESAQVDPKRFFKNQSTGDKILSAIGVFLMGLGGGAEGVQAGLNHINQAVRNDIEAQAEDLRTKKGAVSAQRGILGIVSEMFEDQRSQVEAAQLLSMKKVDAMIAELAAQSSSDVVQAKALEARGILNQQMAEKFMEFSKREQGRITSQESFKFDRGGPVFGGGGKPKEIPFAERKWVAERLNAASAATQGLTDLSALLRKSSAAEGGEAAGFGLFTGTAVDIVGEKIGSRLISKQGVRNRQQVGLVAQMINRALNGAKASDEDKKAIESVILADGRTGSTLAAIDAYKRAILQAQRNVQEAAPQAFQQVTGQPDNPFARDPSVVGTTPPPLELNKE